MRCQSNGLMGAAILITLGVLWLLHTYGVVRINESIPVLLLVTGGILLISRTGSTEGHVQPGWIQDPTAPPPAQQPWASGAVPPPPPPQPEQWVSGAGNPPSSSDQNDSQVKP
jgi:hypothetical protein